MSAQLGNLEETILLLVVILGDKEAYGVSIAKAYKEKLNKSISIPAVHTVLKRLEEKGLVKSTFGAALPVRGGKRKRIYNISKLGFRILDELRENRTQLWQLIPSTNLTR